MKVACLLVLLCAGVVYQAEAGWWKKTLGWIGGAVDTVVSFFGKKERRRRELKEELDPATLQKVERICKEHHLTELAADGVTFEMISIAFQKVDEEDGKDDGALDASKMDDFLSTVEVFKHCLKKNEKATPAAA
ncbi:uncharacterized protein LOC143301384 [Babylonia areolata]|uniref:uncharacterized protein LOC143301384 n=1 Tax=Babylonia areolata TaxID=304850 RepID=UPI003FCF8C1B